jgi:hypothetical protein
LLFQNIQRFSYQNELEIGSDSKTYFDKNGLNGDENIVGRNSNNETGKHGILKT